MIRTRLLHVNNRAYTAKDRTLVTFPKERIWLRYEASASSSPFLISLLTSGCLGRRKAKRARAIRAPLLKSRRLHYMAEEAIRDGNFDDAMEYLTEVAFTQPMT